jgi:hypothetical protein
MLLSKAPAENKLQQEVKDFFSNQTLAEVEQELYDMLQLSLEHEAEPHHCKNRLHLCREITHFMYRLQTLL